MTDTQIINGVNSKRADAYNKLFNMFYVQLSYFAMKMVGNREDAKDLAARTFAVLWEKPREFQSVPQLRSFLFTVTKNACLSFIRDNNIRTGHLERLAAEQVDRYSERVVTETELLHELYGAVKQLPERARQAFVLIHLEGMSREEAARAMNISELTIKKHLQLAVAKLRLLLGETKLSIALAIIHYMITKK